MNPVDHVCAGGKLKPGPQFFGNCGSSYKGSALKQMHIQTGPYKVRSGHQAVMTRAYNSDIYVH
jgi:hypothetical protein